MISIQDSVSPIKYLGNIPYFIPYLLSSAFSN